MNRDRAIRKLFAEVIDHWMRGEYALNSEFLCSDQEFRNAEAERQELINDWKLRLEKVLNR